MASPFVKGRPNAEEPLRLPESAAGSSQVDEVHAYNLCVLCVWYLCLGRRRVRCRLILSMGLGKQYRRG